jgi:hypothetical protein
MYQSKFSSIKTLPILYPFKVLTGNFQQLTYEILFTLKLALKLIFSCAVALTTTEKYHVNSFFLNIFCNEKLPLSSVPFFNDSSCFLLSEDLMHLDHLDRLQFYSKKEINTENFVMRPKREKRTAATSNENFH